MQVRPPQQRHPTPPRSLNFLFEKHLSNALQIIDQGGVFCFVGEKSGRRVYQVPLGGVGSGRLGAAVGCPLQPRRLLRQ